MVAFANEDSDEEIYESDIHFHSGVRITPIHVIFKGDSDDD